MTSELNVCSHVKVVVRVRPENEREKQGNFNTVVQVVDNHMLVFDPKVEEVNFFQGRRIANRDITKKKNKDVKFVFDRVFGEYSTQDEVFEHTTKFVLDGVLNGYNCTVLAYGATGAGKTHTMLGTAGQPGVMYLTMMDLYNRIEIVKEEKLCDVALSYLEVYNEQIRDLLANSGPLAVREDAQKGVVVQGLTLHQPLMCSSSLMLGEYYSIRKIKHTNASERLQDLVQEVILRIQDKVSHTFPIRVIYWLNQPKGLTGQTTGDQNILGNTINKEYIQYMNHQSRKTYAYTSENSKHTPPSTWVMEVWEMLNMICNALEMEDGICKIKLLTYYCHIIHSITINKVHSYGIGSLSGYNYMFVRPPTRVKTLNINKYNKLYPTLANFLKYALEIMHWVQQRHAGSLLLRATKSCPKFFAKYTKILPKDQLRWCLRDDVAGCRMENSVSLYTQSHPTLSINERGVQVKVLFSTRANSLQLQNWENESTTHVGIILEPQQKYYIKPSSAANTAILIKNKQEWNLRRNKQLSQRSRLRNILRWALWTKTVQSQASHRCLLKEYSNLTTRPVQKLKAPLPPLLEELTGACRDPVKSDPNAGHYRHYDDNRLKKHYSIRNTNLSERMLRGTLLQHQKSSMEYLLKVIACYIQIINTSKQGGSQRRLFTCTSPPLPPMNTSIRIAKMDTQANANIGYNFCSPTESLWAARSRVYGRLANVKQAVLTSSASGRAETCLAPTIFPWDVRVLFQQVKCICDIVRFRAIPGKHKSSSSPTNKSGLKGWREPYETGIQNQLLFVNLTKFHFKGNKMAAPRFKMTSELNVCSHVKVVVRVRPENEREKQGNFNTVVQVVDNHMLVFDPKVEEVNFFQGRRIANRDITKKKNKDVKFVFDRVFGEYSTQDEVFEHTTKFVLDGVLNGYNCTVLAYGATGAGKTHTMLGTAGQPGVMYLTMMDLYNRIEIVKEEKLCDVALSYLEVYNEQIRDLLANSGPLAVREDAQKGVVVQGLTLHQPKSAEEILQLLDYGNKNRTQHPTDVNASSSRSHAVLQIYLRQQEKTASINQNVRLAKMSLIDLAGSERASATNAKGARLREGTNINRSLLALGNVINALTDPKTKKQHIPYRNSKLTRLLKDSLGGNCRTIMIAAVSPSSLSYEDTYNTLKYANRAKDIKSAVKSNVVSLDSHISQYAKICEEQKKEIAMLKEKLKAYEEQRLISDQPNGLRQSSQEQTEIKRYQEGLKSIFKNREDIRADYLNQEMRMKENELKTFYQRQHLEQIQMISSQEKVVKATGKRDHRLEVLKNQSILIQKKKEEEIKRFEENTNWLHRIENEMRLLGHENKMPEELGRDLQCCHLKLEVKDLKAQIEHMTRLMTLHERENRYNEKLLNALLPNFRKQYLLLKQAGVANVAVETDFEEIEHLVSREKAVVWADQSILEDLNKLDGPELASIVSFPHLISNQTTPCRGERCAQQLQLEGRKAQTESTRAVVKPTVAEKTLTDDLSSEFEETLPHQPSDNVIPPKKTRRKLMPSPLCKENVDSRFSKKNQHNDSVLGDLVPIVYTPESCNRTINLPKEGANVPCLQEKNVNLTHFTTKDQVIPTKQVAKVSCLQEKGENATSFMAHDKGKQNFGFTFRMTTGVEKAEMNSTVILSEDNNDVNCDLPRTALPSLQSKNLGKPNEKPSYMAMTSAAERKRKLLSLAGNSALKEDNPLLPTAKRVKQDIPFECKALRVRKLEGGLKSKDSGAQRRLPRSISEGNLPFGAKKKPFSFLGSTYAFRQNAKKK
ncbi:kinesin KIF18A [Pelobates cultripes]|nr:kinesin KIF18A [Pelobates cultripes]